MIGWTGIRRQRLLMLPMLWPNVSSRHRSQCMRCWHVTRTQSVVDLPTIPCCQLCLCWQLWRRIRQKSVCLQCCSCSGWLVKQTRQVRTVSAKLICYVATSCCSAEVQNGGHDAMHMSMLANASSVCTSMLGLRHSPVPGAARTACKVFAEHLA